MTGTPDGAEGDPRGAEPPAVWPPGEPLADDDAVPCACASCGRAWRVHRDLAGYRLRCGCGGWIEVPAATRALALSANAALAALNAPIYESPLAPAKPEMAPATERRWVNRTLLELVGLVGAFWVPAFAIQHTLAGEERALWMPVAALFACLLVLAVGLLSPRYAFSGLRVPGARDLVEAVAATAAFLAAAFAFQWLMERALPGHEDLLVEFVDALGVPMALLSLAVVPALFEELAFRGLLQARLETLYGPLQGVLLSGAAFGLAHGVTLFIPIHLALGLYLGWLRLRSGSLLPGMMLHLLYNGVLIAT
jgi:membrane protease YdiL (CAAX protease family)